MKDAGVLFYHSLPYSHETGSFAEPRAWLKTNKPWGSPCLPPVTAMLGFQVCDHTWLFTWVPGIELGSSCLSSRSLHLSSPRTRFFKTLLSPCPTAEDLHLLGIFHASLKSNFPLPSLPMSPGRWKGQFRTSTLGSYSSTGFGCPLPQPKEVRICEPSSSQSRETSLLPACQCGR
jgi:hypothetical protein